MRTSNLKTLSWKYPRVYVNRIVPTNKIQEELYISEMLKNAIKGISSIELSEDDANKGSDTYCIWDEQKKGIQVTRFAISNSRSTAIVAQKLSIKILENIYYRVRPEHRTIITFDSIYDEKNEIVKIKKKKLTRLCDYLVDEINKHKHIHYQKTDLKYWMYPYSKNVPEFLKPDIKAIQFQHPPEDHIMYIPGRDNIWLNWNFNIRSIDENIIAQEASSIYNKKNGGTSEILLIWCDLNEVYNRIDEIKQELCANFKETSFEYVFLVALRDREDMIDQGFQFHPIHLKYEIVLDENNIKEKQ